jgi:hypothetical protein
MGLLKRLTGTADAAPDPEAFFDALLAAQVGGQSKTDIYRDFRRTFSTPEGKRVLWRLFEWCHLYKPSVDFDSAARTAFREGERNIALKIMAVMNAEPVDDITTVRERERDGR